MKAWSIIYQSSSNPNLWPMIETEGTLEEAKEFALEERLKRHIPECKISILEIAKPKLSSSLAESVINLIQLEQGV